ncbi:hypothetical protein Glove_71g8 [Diversispora epigaea]|uniref:Uncharacterized protein n=1 Tax=Diversispora epigaea TaxID=1348612 RepID=A0A397JEB6_9GLOM|nr:hypothetical protein Glove_71g8 [Diversispora epigaea]
MNSSLNIFDTIIPHIASMSYELSYNARDKLFSIHNSLKEVNHRKNVHHFTPHEIDKGMFCLFANNKSNPKELFERSLKIENSNKNNSNGNDEMMDESDDLVQTNSTNSRISMDLSTG